MICVFPFFPHFSFDLFLRFSVDRKTPVHHRLGLGFDEVAYLN